MIRADFVDFTLKFLRVSPNLPTDWDSKRHVVRRREFQPLHKRLLLEEIAWHFHLRSSRYFSEHELLAVIARFLPAIGLQPEDSKRILQEIANENGILKEQAQGWYGFIHMTLQEYCAAQYLTDHNELETLMQYVDDPRWEEVVLLYAGQAADASQLLERLMGKAANAPTDDIFRNNLIMAGRCLAARPTIRRKELREEIPSSLFTLLKTTFYSLTRQQVIETLLGLGDPNVNKRLLDLFNNIQFQHPEFIRILVRLGKQALEPGLLAMIKDERCAPDLRCKLIKQISVQTIERAFPDFLAMIKDERCSPDVRCELVQRIRSGRRVDGIFEPVLPDLLSLLKDNQRNSLVRVAIVNACKYVSHTDKQQIDVIAELRNVVKNEPHTTIVYRSALLALGYLGETVPASEVLLFLSNEQDSSSVQEMCRLLARLEDNTVIPGLLHILKNGQTNRESCRAVAEVIYSLDKSIAAPELLNLLGDEQLNYEARGEIGSILVRMSVVTMPMLLSRLRDKGLSIYIGLLALISLSSGSRGETIIVQEERKKLSTEIVSELLSLLRNKQFDAHQRNYIARNLKAILGYGKWPVSITQEILGILKNEPKGTPVHNNLVLMIATQKETSVLQDVLLLLKERRYPDQYKEFYNVISILKDQKFVADLLALLTDRQQSPDLRGAVAEALEGLIDDDETTAQLAHYAPRLYIDEKIYDSLWRLSRRTGVKILA